MCRTIGLLLGATVLLMGLVSTASAQPKGRGRRGGNDSLPTLAGYEAVQKELGISGDLAEKLGALRDDMLAARQKEEQIAGIGPQDFQSMSDETRQKMTQISSKLNEEFVPRLKVLISADQIKRLNEIRVQSLLAIQGPPAITAPEVAAELALTDEQKRRLNALNGELAERQREISRSGFDPAANAKLREERVAKTTELLTAEQKEKLKTMTGSPFDVGQLVGGFGGFGGPGGRKGKGN
jgi:hypothetical protein